MNNKKKLLTFFGLLGLLLPQLLQAPLFVQSSRKQVQPTQNPLNALKNIHSSIMPDGIIPAMRVTKQAYQRLANNLTHKRVVSQNVTQIDITRRVTEEQTLSAEQKNYIKAEMKKLEELNIKLHIFGSAVIKIKAQQKADANDKKNHPEGSWIHKIKLARQRTGLNPQDDLFLASHIKRQITSSLERLFGSGFLPGPQSQTRANREAVRQRFSSYLFPAINKNDLGKHIELKNKDLLSIKKLLLLSGILNQLNVDYSSRNQIQRIDISKFRDKNKTKIKINTALANAKEAIATLPWNVLTQDAKNFINNLHFVDSPTPTHPTLHAHPVPAALQNIPTHTESGLEDRRFTPQHIPPELHRGPIPTLFSESSPANTEDFNQLVEEADQSPSTPVAPFGPNIGYRLQHLNRAVNPLV